MSIIYCDWSTGDDGTGDGSAGNPYKTITTASTGLTGGDEVRVAKSTAEVVLSGTLTFTINSTAIIGNSTSFTTELVIGDFIKGNDGEYYEVITITDDTNAVLFKKYPSATTSGVTSYNLGVTSTGVAAVTATEVQVVSSNGTSEASMLKISGGWDLTGPTQDGETYFRQMHSSFAFRWGRGLTATTKNYIEVEKLHFLRYDNCMFLNNCDYWKVTGANLLSAGDEALYLTYCYYGEYIDVVCNSAADKGFYINKSTNITFTRPIANSCVYGFYLNVVDNCVFDSLIAKYDSIACVYIKISYSNTFNSLIASNSPKGVYFLGGSYNNIITSPVIDNCDSGAYASSSENNIVNNFSGTGNSSDFRVAANAYHDSEMPFIKAQHIRTSGINKCYYENGYTALDTTDARSTQCLKVDPSSDIYYIRQQFYFVADTGVEKTITAYIKEDGTFNGDVQAALFFNEEIITAWAEWTPTTSYVQQSIVGAAVDIIDNGVIELRIKVRGAAGRIFVDDLESA